MASSQILIHFSFPGTQLRFMVIIEKDESMRLKIGEPLLTMGGNLNNRYMDLENIFYIWHASTK
jgi:hypothetical protein